MMATPPHHNHHYPARPTMDDLNVDHVNGVKRPALPAELRTEYKDTGPFLLALDMGLAIEGSDTSIQDEDEGDEEMEEDQRGSSGRSQGGGYGGGGSVPEEKYQIRGNERDGSMMSESSGKVGSQKGKTKSKKQKDDKEKKRRQSQSCDHCRLSKVKCAEATSEDITTATNMAGATGLVDLKLACTGPAVPRNPDGRLRGVCKHCLVLGLVCTFEYIPRKRGPPNQYQKKLQEQQALSLDPPPPLDRRPTLPSSSSSSSAPYPPRVTLATPLPGIPNITQQAYHHGIYQSSSSPQTVTGFSPSNAPSASASGSTPMTTGLTPGYGGATGGNGVYGGGGGGMEYEPTSFVRGGSQVERDGSQRRSDTQGTYHPDFRSSGSLGSLMNTNQNINQRSDHMFLGQSDRPVSSETRRSIPSNTARPDITSPSYATERSMFDGMPLGERNAPLHIADLENGDSSRKANMFDPNNSMAYNATAGPGPSSLAMRGQPSSSSMTLGSIGARDNMPLSSFYPDPNLSFLDPSPLPHVQPVFNPLDLLLPRPLLLHIINLFFDYVYPLTPCLHKPTFLKDLLRRREEQPGEEEWVALVLATVSITLVQVPRAYVPLGRREIKDLAERCFMETRLWGVGVLKVVTLNSVVIKFFGAVYSYLTGIVSTCHTSLCESQALATVLKLHEEDSYMFLNPIEKELRRRIFFLLFGADKSEALLLGRPVRLREEDCYSLRLPEEIDDDYITENRYVSQPAGVTSVITGFNAITRVYCYLGRIIAKYREDKREAPTGAKLQLRLQELTKLSDDVMAIMEECPPALRLKTGMNSRAVSPAGDWDITAQAQLQEFFFDPKASREVARDAFLVQQGNIYVTQQLVRFVILQYRNDLLCLEDNSKWTGNRPIGSRANQDHTAREKEELFYDLLTVLHNIPIQCIAVNGPSLVNKVRYVASTLLDTVQTTKTEKPGPSNSSDTSGTVLRAQGYLVEFLNILSEIERNYILAEEEEENGA